MTEWDFEPELEFMFAELRDPGLQAELERLLDEYDDSAAGGASI